jgi:peptide/nickel transport system permease protein
MTAVLPPTAFLPSLAPARRPLARRLLGNPLGVISLTYLVLIVLVATVGPLLIPYDPNASTLRDVFAPAGPEHLLGADSAGRDVLSRIVVASSLSLAGASVTVLVAAAVGIPAGLIAGYRGGWFDAVSSWVTGLLLSLPGVVVLLAVRAAIGPSMFVVMAVFGLLIAPAYYRVVYGAVRAVREELYIDAAVVAGLSDGRIIGRHVLSAVRAPAILLTSGIFAVGIAIQATLDFLGLGDPALPTWGSMLAEGFYNIYRTPTLMLWPSLAIGLTCVAFTLLGIAIRDELELAGDSRDRRRAQWSAPHPRPEAPVLHDAATTEPPLLEIDGLSVAYPRGDDWSTVVDDLSLRIAPGEVHALIGESGSGKTQTAWSVLGLLPDGGRVTAGAIRFDGADLRTAGPRALERLRGRRIGYVPQEPITNLDPSSTVGAHLTEPLRVVLGMTAPAARTRALELLERVGIPDPLRTYRSHPHEISGGMAQRVLIAGAVSCDPALVVADEPTTALDVTVQAEILELLRDLQRETGAAMLLVTHNFGVVADLADRVSVMRAGSIVETGPVAEVFADPRHEYTRGLFAALLRDAPGRGPLDGVTA